MLNEGTIREINGDQYLVIFDHGEMETLQKDGFLSIYFPNMSDVSEMGILIPIGKVKRPSRQVKETPNTLEFNNVTFAKGLGFDKLTTDTKNIFAKVHCDELVFSVGKSNKLLGVSFK